MPIFNLRGDPGGADAAGAGNASTTAAGGTTTAPSAAGAAASAAEESFPEIKGRVESKLMSMWHNVKYGWSGQIRANNFSKEQPVWLLGRCYHPKFSPTSSMESSAEMTASMENKLSLADYPPLPPTHHPTPHHQRSLSAGAPTPHHTTNAAAPTVVVMQPIPTDYAVEEDADYAADAAIEVGELGTSVDLSGSSRWEEGIDGFRRDFGSRLWMTYRREFPILNGSNYTSDCGWGCMLRSGQMLLAQALLCHFLGRSWRWDPDSQLHTTHEDLVHRKIVRWFGDTPSKNSPFSIHTLVTIGLDAGKKAGDWYGPASVSHLLKRAVRMASQENADFDGLHVYVAQDCTVYIQDILDECLVPDPVQQAKAMPWQQQTPDRSRGEERRGTAESASPAAASGGGGNGDSKHLLWKALVLLVPLRLGTEKLNAIYGNCLKTLLSTEHCIGIIGGRPKHSLYFVGFQEDKLIHLDPHYCQEMVDVNADNFSPATFHCRSPRKLKLNKLDPSCCIGFYCQTRADFERFVATVQTYLLPVRLSPTATTMTSSLNGCMSASMSSATTTTRQPSGDCAYPMFVFSRSRSTDQHVDETRPAAVHQMGGATSPVAAGEEASSAVAGDDDDGDETEEFVML